MREKTRNIEQIKTLSLYVCFTGLRQRRIASSVVKSLPFLTSWCAADVAQCNATLRIVVSYFIYFRRRYKYAQVRSQIDCCADVAEMSTRKSRQIGRTNSGRVSQILRKVKRSIMLLLCCCCASPSPQQRDDDNAPRIVHENDKYNHVSNQVRIVLRARMHARAHARSIERTCCC